MCQALYQIWNSEIDTLNIAINQGCKVSIKLLKWSMEGEDAEDTMIISPYATVWAKGNYYCIGKREDTETLTHYKVDEIKDILILEYGIDMIFGGFNPTQYAKKYIYQNGEEEGYFEVRCKSDLWSDVINSFGEDALIQSKWGSELGIRIKAIKSDVKQFVMNHVSECEVIKPQTFREEIQLEVLEAYKKYWK